MRAAALLPAAALPPSSSPAFPPCSGAGAPSAAACCWRPSTVVQCATMQPQQKRCAQVRSTGPRSRPRQMAH